MASLKVLSLKGSVTPIVSKSGSKFSTRKLHVSVEPETTKDGVVLLRYDDLVAGKDYSKSIEKAYGYDGIGLLAVLGAPTFVEQRARLLPLAFEFSQLPNDVKAKVEHKKSSYSYGWSHGKEILQPGKFDTFKGSYYNNPQYDQPTTDKAIIEKYVESAHPNIWPDADFPALKPAFKEMGQLITSVGALVAQNCDKYADQVLGARVPENQLSNIIKTSRTCKARLLYYFPINEDKTPRARDSWCGWHNDHGSLTGLVPNMFINESERKFDIPSPDPEAGLYVRTRAGKEFQVRVPKDAIAFQIGESSQVLTGGLLRATPHAVQAPKYPAVGIGRASFAVFMQPDNDYKLELPVGSSEGEAAVGQYKKGQTFIDFHKATIAGYYGDN